MFEQFVLCFCLRLIFCDIRPIRNHQLIGFTPKDQQVSASQQLRIILMQFFIGYRFGVVAAAI